MAVFTSDLRRAVETAEIAFGATGIPILHDWRLRECDYGSGNGMPAVELHADRPAYLDRPYPGGESWRQAVARVARFFGDLPLRWSGQRVCVIGHVATRWAFDHYLDGRPLEQLINPTSRGSLAGSTASRTGRNPGPGMMPDRALRWLEGRLHDQPRQRIPLRSGVLS